MEEIQLQQGSALIVVAHPDDETIWMGGTILKFPGIKWTIFSLCRSDDRDRAPKFRRVCKYYGARGIISDLEDEGIMNARESLPEIEKRIRREVKEKNFTHTFTHGYNGEYGHPRHKGVYKTVLNLIRAEKIKTERLFTFSYQMAASGNFALPEKEAGIGLALTRNISSKKKFIIEHMYGFSKQSFEYKSSWAKEAFREMRVL